MQIRLFFIILLLGITVFQGCKSISGNDISLNGSFTNLSDTKLYIYQILPAGKTLIDSVSTDASGNFNLSFPVNTAGYYTLFHNAEDAITMVIAPRENLVIKGDGRSMHNTYSVEGSADSKIYAVYNSFTAVNLAKVDSLSRIFTESRSNPDFLSVKNRLDAEYMAIFNDQKEKAISFVGCHLNSLASLLIISNNFGPNPLLSEHTQTALFMKLDSTLHLSYPENPFVNTFHSRMLQFKTELTDIQVHDKLLRPGMPAPDITLPNSFGKIVKLSSFRGKLTLLYFWSSWNAVSRQTNINLSGIYNQYKEHGFEIYAVSLDSDTELWKKAYTLDKAWWIQVTDTSGLKSEYGKTYAVKAFPKMILIGKDGKIIATNPGLEELKGLIKANL